MALVIGRGGKKIRGKAGDPGVYWPITERGAKFLWEALANCRKKYLPLATRMCRNHTQREDALALYDFRLWQSVVSLQKRGIDPLEHGNQIAFQAARGVLSKRLDWTRGGRLRGRPGRRQRIERPIYIHLQAAAPPAELRARDQSGPLTLGELIANGMNGAQAADPARRVEVKIDFLWLTRQFAENAIKGFRALAVGFKIREAADIAGVCQGRMTQLRQRAAKLWSER